MTPKEAYEELFTAYEEIDKSLVRPPVYKIEDRVVEGQRLHKVAMAQGEEFEILASVKKFDMFNVVALDTAALSLRYTESEWIVLHNPSRSSEFREKIELVEKMRSGFLRDLDYVNTRFAPDDLGRALTEIRQGSSRQDTLQDVETLVSLTRRHQNELGKIGFDPEAADSASNLAAELGRVLNVDKDDMEKAKDARNRASTLLERMMTEVRATADFLFRNDPNKLAGFADQGR